MRKFEPLSVKKRKVILDTDIGPDCDDVGAIILLDHWATEYGFDIAGVVNCTSNTFGTAAVDVLMKYCGREDVPLGEYKRSVFNAEGLTYNKYLAENYPNDYIDGKKTPYDSDDLYYKILSEAEDDGVIIITVGMLNTVWNAFEKYPDLFRKKVNSVVSMAAQYRKGYEYNVFCHAEAAKNFCENIPCPVYFSGFELGEDIITGFEVPDDSNPAAKAYELHCGESMKRPSWDLVTVMFAVCGTGKYFALSESGRVIVDDAGNNTYESSTDGNHAFIIPTVRKSFVETEINNILRKSR